MAYDSETFIVTELPVVERDPLTLTSPRERLEWLSHFLRNLPDERFSMSCWLRMPKDFFHEDFLHAASDIAMERYNTTPVSVALEECGTSACIAGWAIAKFRPDRSPGDISFSEEAANILGLSFYESAALFLCNMKATNIEAADTIDRYLATGVVRWDVEETGVIV